MSKIVDIRVKCKQDDPLYVSISDLRPGDIVISGTMWQPEWGYCTVGSDNVFRVVEIPEEVALEAIGLETVAYHDLSRQFGGVLAWNPQTHIGKVLEREIVFKLRLAHRLDLTTKALRSFGSEGNAIIAFCDINSDLLAEVEAANDEYNKILADYLESQAANQDLIDYDETIASFEAGTGRM